MSLKIVQIIPALEAGGAERTVIDITLAVVGAGGQALTITAGGRLEEELIAAGGQIARLPVQSKNPWRMWRNTASIVSIAKRFGAQLIHARSRAPAWSAQAACRQLGIPFVTTYHGTYTARGALKRRYNAIMASGDAVIANSNFIAAHIIAEHRMDQHGTKAQRIAIIARGVDPVFFGLPEKQKASTNRKPQIILPARFTRLKGHVLALDALALLRDDAVQAELVFAGDTQGREGYAKELGDHAKRLGLDRRVSFAGHVSDMAALYARADIVLCTSTEPESFGRTVVEAQASARLSIAPAHGGALETVIDGQTGFLFAPGDAQDLARVLQRVLCLEPAQGKKICRAARTRAARLYSREAMCAKTLGVYYDVTGIRV